MGFFNDSSAVDSLAINAYCIVSALFFSACAYAQLNDPYPVVFFTAYVFGGTVPNLYWMTLASCVGGSKASGSNSITQTLVLAIRGFVALLVLFILYKLIVLAPKLLEDVSEHHHGLLWAFMEFEEGRDSIGLLLLVMHASYLNSVLERGPNPPPRRSPRNSDSEGGALAAVPTTVIVVGLFGVLSLCVYTWIVHHPDLVAKHGLKHCQGEMFAGIGGDL